MLKDAARALSLANLCFIGAWTILLSDSTASQVRFDIYIFSNYLAILINVLLLAAAFGAAITIARRSGNKLLYRVAQLVFPLALLVPLNGFFWMLLPELKIVTEIIIVCLVVLRLSLFEIKPWHNIIIRTASAVVLVLFPFFFITFFQVFLSLTKFSEKPPARPFTSKNASTPRVLLLIFDEMDQRMAFTKRPATIQLPEFDRFRNQAIYASNAYPPADFTTMSIPALITGKLISKAEPISPSELMITFADTEVPVRWSSQPNLFSKAREVGVNTALTGFYFPYNRIIGEDLNISSYHASGSAPLGKSMFKQVEILINSIPLVYHLPTRLGIINNKEASKRFERQKALEAYLGIMEDAKKLVVDLDLGLIMVHLSVPHPPGIYNRHRDDFEFGGESSYLDSLQLADRSLGELRQVMEDAGMWDNTVILATSDHWWRGYLWRSLNNWTSEDEEIMPGDDDHRVPFMLKLAGQKHALPYDPEFNTVLTHDLLLGLLKGELSGPDSVLNWLDRNRSIGESPYRFEKQK